MTGTPAKSGTTSDISPDSASDASLGGDGQYVAWAGLGLTVPREWQPGAIERDGLRLEDGLGRPAFEFKRTPVRGAFSLKKHFTRVARSFRDGEVRREVPDAWAEALRRVGCDGLPFAWTAKNGGSGLGAVLHFPDSGAAALVQAMLREGEPTAGHALPAAVRVLSGLRDYGADEWLPVALYDIRALLPGALHLTGFHFRPGHFRLVYGADAAGRHGPPTTEIRLDRVAPADVVLGGSDAAGWAEKFFAELRPSGFESLADETLRDAAGDGAVEAVCRPPRCLIPWLRERPGRLRVWSPAGSNRLLAVSARGRRPVEPSVFEEVCDAYALVPS